MSKMDHSPVRATAEVSDALSHPTETSLSHVMDVVEKEKKTMSPKQYGNFLSDVNSTLSHDLPGLSIVGLDKQNGASRLELRDALGQSSYFGRADEKAMENMIAHRPKVVERGNGAYEIISEDGVRVKLQDNADGSRTERRSGPNPMDNFVMHTSPDGTERTQFADGFGRETTYDKDGSAHTLAWQLDKKGNHIYMIAPATQPELGRAELEHHALDYKAAGKSAVKAVTGLLKDHGIF